MGGASYQGGFIGNMLACGPAVHIPGHLVSNNYCDEHIMIMLIMTTSMLKKKKKQILARAI